MPKPSRAGGLTEHCMVLRIDCPDGDEVQSPKSRDQNLNGRSKSGILASDHSRWSRT